MSNNLNSANNLVIKDHHLISKNQILVVSKLISKELYKLLITIKEEVPSVQIYYDKYFENINLNWKEIYLLPRLVTLDTRLRIFLYKIHHNVLYLNKMLFKFKLASTPLCSYCNTEEETPIHIFYACEKTRYLWNILRQNLLPNMNIPFLTPQSAICGLYSLKENFHIVNHLLILYKYFIYNARDNGKTSYANFKIVIKNTSNIERKLSENEPKKKQRYLKKWKKVNEILKF